MLIKCGIIGLPNVGKSSLFNFLTNLNIKVANYPFSTINPNIGFLPYLDKRLIFLFNQCKSNKLTPSYLTIIDIAGLITGAHKGEGLGNLFLNNILSSSILLHVIRCFYNKEIIHVYNNINPIRDINIINNELILKDLDICQKLIKYKKIEKITYKLLEKCLLYLKQNKLLNSVNWTNQELILLKSINLLSIKPIIYIANNNNNCTLSMSITKKLIYYCNQNQFPIIIFNNNFTNTNNKIKINKLISIILNKLNIYTFFTIGKQETKSWFIKKQSNIIQGAELIHSDFKKLFIKAKIIPFKNFYRYKNLKQKEKIYGKNYIINNGDIIEFIINK